MAFEDIEWLNGRDNMPGLVGDIKFIPTNEIDLAAATIDDDGVTVSGTIGLQPSGRISNIYATDRSQGSRDKNQGAIGGSSSEISHTWLTPG